MPERRLASARKDFLVGPMWPSALTLLLKLSAVAYTKRWGTFSVSLGLLTRLTIVLGLCTIVGRSGEDFKCSASFQ